MLSSVLPQRACYSQSCVKSAFLSPSSCFLFYFVSCTLCLVYFLIFAVVVTFSCGPHLLPFPHLTFIPFPVSFLCASSVPWSSLPVPPPHGQLPLSPPHRRLPLSPPHRQLSPPHGQLPRTITVLKTSSVSCLVLLLVSLSASSSPVSPTRSCSL